MKKLVYLGLLILELSKILMYELWYDYVKLEYDEKTNLCFIDTNSSTVYIKKIIFTKILQKTLKQDLTLHIMN